jgi:acyl dehydratase
MPGVLIIEAIFQASLLLVHATTDHSLLFSGVEIAEFIRPVRQGDRTDLEVTVFPRDKGWLIEGRCAAFSNVRSAIPPFYRDPPMSAPAQYYLGFRCPSARRSAGGSVARG